MSQEKVSKAVHFVIRGLPLAGVAVTSLVFNSAWIHQFLVLIALLWFQVFILSEAFSSGR